MREYLARKDVAHDFVDVRKAPISKKDTVAIVRRHTRALAKVGGKIREIDPKKATDPEILELFLGREGTMRAPVVSKSGTIFAGFDEPTFRAVVG